MGVVGLEAPSPFFRKAARRVGVVGPGAAAGAADSSTERTADDAGAAVAGEAAIVGTTAGAGAAGADAFGAAVGVAAVLSSAIDDVRPRRKKSVAWLSACRESRKYFRRFIDLRLCKFSLTHILTLS